MSEKMKRKMKEDEEVLRKEEQIKKGVERMEKIWNEMKEIKVKER